MPRSNRIWLPRYCSPEAYLPKIQETRSLFSRPPFLFQDFVGRALGFLQSSQAKKLGFDYDEKFVIPCKWKCSDESLFGVDLSIYAYTGLYPFNKGRIGGRFYENSIGASVHHGPINVDFGGSHVGYIPDDSGGSFGVIWRPQIQELTTDCGHLLNVIDPFKEVYEEACKRIKVFKPIGAQHLISIPNEYIQPSWCSTQIKLLVDTEAITDGDVLYDAKREHTRTPIGRTRFYLKKGLLEKLTKDGAKKFDTPKPTPIGRHLTHHFFNIFDSSAEIDEFGLPKQKLNLYMKHILSARNSPYSLKAAIVNTNLEYSRLTDTYAHDAFRNYAFASFTGIFIDFFDHQLSTYLNLFQPIGLSIKPKGGRSMIEFPPEEIHSLINSHKPIIPKRSLQEVMGYDLPDIVAEKFLFTPGEFSEPPKISEHL